MSEGRFSGNLGNLLPRTGRSSLFGLVFDGSGIKLSSFRGGLSVLQY